MLKATGWQLLPDHACPSCLEAVLLEDLGIELAQILLVEGHEVIVLQGPVPIGAAKLLSLPN